MDQTLLVDPLGLACNPGTHPASNNSADARRILEASKTFFGRPYHGANGIVCNQLVDRSINQAFPGTVSGGPNTRQMGRGEGPFSQTDTPRVGDLALMSSPGHVVLVTAVNEDGSVSQFIGSQTSSGPAEVNLPNRYWTGRMTEPNNVKYLQVCIPD